jgi:predicted NUDIX family NTP pyrophosphohydrolase
MYRRTRGRLEVLLVHPGGPFWAGKDRGAWSIPKGEHGPEEDALDAARREFVEETGIEPRGDFLRLAPLVQRGGKIVHAFAFEGDCDPAAIRSNTFSMEWPRGSGRRQEFPEVDRAEWLALDEAAEKILPSQAPLLVDLARRLGEPTGQP